MQIVTIEVEPRERNKKKGAKAVRNSGRIPAVLYGGDEVSHFSVTKKDVKTLIYTGDFKLAKIVVDGQEVKAIIKEIQFHPVTDEIEHIDFLRLVDGVPIKVELPIRFKGQSPGEKEGGKLTQMLRKVNIKTMPENLVDQLLVDISELNLGHSVRLRDLELMEGMEVLNPIGTPIASVEVPRVLKELDEEEAELEGVAGEATEGGETQEEAATEEA